MTTTDREVAVIAAGLTKTPRICLLSCPGGEVEWLAIISAMPNGGYRQSHLRAIKPLLDRGLLIRTREHSFDGENWTSALYSLTPAGLAVRAHLASQERDKA